MKIFTSSDIAHFTLPPQGLGHLAADAKNKRRSENWPYSSDRPFVYNRWQDPNRIRSMLKWALIFLVIALVAGALGFTGVAAASASIAKVLFGIFLVIFLILLVLGIAAGEKLFK